MTITRVTTGYQNTIYALLKCFYNKKGIYSTGTRNTNYPNIWWILNSGNTGKVGASIRAPIT
jgi:hypothetical protein